ncbi:MAG TPA: hypothetical protein VMX16_17015 [Terriglobia bacterium]|nr:hypothetical protein [Terriglobia bacterium]
MLFLTALERKKKAGIFRLIRGLRLAPGWMGFQAKMDSRLRGNDDPAASGMTVTQGRPLWSPAGGHVARTCLWKIA